MSRKRLQQKSLRKSRWESFRDFSQSAANMEKQLTIHIDELQSSQGTAHSTNLRSFHVLRIPSAFTVAKGVVPRRGFPLEPDHIWPAKFVVVWSGLSYTVSCDDVHECAIKGDVSGAKVTCRLSRNFQRFFHNQQDFSSISVNFDTIWRKSNNGIRKTHVAATPFNTPTVPLRKSSRLRSRS